MSDLVLAATTWPTNAAMISDCARLGYLKREAVTLDPTWGKGKWWTDWCPQYFTRHDKYTLDGVDFRDLPHADGSFEQIGYDPPYVCPGGLKSSTTKRMHADYGMSSGGVAIEAERDFKTPAQLQTIMNDGLTEMARVLGAKGVVVMKCKDYIWGGKLHEGTYETRKHAESLGLRIVDRLEHLSIKPGPQSQTAQDHARRNLSTLFVFSKPPGRRQTAMAL